MTNIDPNRDTFEEDRVVRANQTNGRSGAMTTAFWVALLLVGGLVFYMSTAGNDNGQQVSQNNSNQAPIADTAAPADPAAPAVEPVQPVQPAQPLAPANP